MRPTRIPSCRLRSSRRTLRPSIQGSKPPHQRQFSQKLPRRFLLTPNQIRPQLPFLYPTQNTARSRLQTSRFLSTSQKQSIKETTKLAFYLWAIGTLASIAGYGFMSERQERAFPSPHEWSLYTRFRFRRGKWWEVPENNEDIGFPNYGRLYSEFEHALKRLEDPRKDGSGIVEQENDGISIPGVGQAGFDVTAKSDEWRQGYWEVLMGMGQAAERMDGFVTDKWHWHVWAPDFVASPSNPRPKATPPGMPLPPEEHEQIPVTAPPETFYIKAITTKGLTTYQRMKAALAYADWLSFKEFNESAEEMYRWALDIAISGLRSQDPSAVINPSTGVLQTSAPKETVTPNLIFAATSLGTYFASSGKISAALPIFVSVLRARRSADVAPPSPPEPPRDSSALGTLITLLKEPQYPPLPSTGDEMLLRRPEDICEEAALMNYIGDILFATSGSDTQKQQGLLWVRDSVSAAKSGQMLENIQQDSERKKKCQECEEAGLESWGKIMTYLVAEAKEKRDKAKAGGLTGLLWKLKGTEELDKAVEELEDVEEGVTLRLAKLRNTMLREYYAEQDLKYARTFVI